MAYATTDYYLRPEDGWVKVATNPAACMIRPTDFFPFRLAVTVSGAPAAGTRASGNVTFSGLPVAAETVTINGQVYTARATRALPFEFTIGTDAETTADFLLAAILADGNGTYTGIDAGVGVVTIQATSAGVAGNAITLAENATNTTVSGAVLTGGVNEVHGLDYGRGGDGLRETIVMPASMTGEVYLRIDRPPSSSPDKM